MEGKATVVSSTRFTDEKAGKKRTRLCASGPDLELALVTDAAGPPVGSEIHVRVDVTAVPKAEKAPAPDPRSSPELGRERGERKAKEAP